jgi:cytochrome b
MSDSPTVPEVPVATVRAWDLPTRLFKWSFVAALVTAWLSSGFNDPDMTVHKSAGYCVFVLMIYRILWGIVGGSTARFVNFVQSPTAVRAYFKEAIRSQAKPYLGHNPAGGLMVIGLLMVCGVQVLLGLVSSDGITAMGPLADLVGDTASATAASIHAAWFYFVILELAGLHIAVNLYHQFFKRDNLIGAMITGRKKQKDYVDGHQVRGGSIVVASACLLSAVAIAYGSITLLGGSLFSSL